MKSKKSAQAAMEFLMTYGWAILIVIIVIGAFVYFGVLNPRELVPRRCTLQGFNCADHKLSASGFELVLTNAYGIDVRVDYVNFSSETADLVTCKNTASALAGTIAMGETLAVNSGSCTFDSSVKAGTRVKGIVTVDFSDPVQGTQHKLVGTVITDVES
ncbi:hypothetical protein JXA85_07715 [Candidatus Woesearchaeota archaeon]|nr:hypothetical protein [Candidatus Woesearchaeota archaeon]